MAGAGRCPGDCEAALRKAGAKPVGAAALERFRIASGIPRYGQDIRERDLPQETEQLRALNFSKGCYVGQEIVERIRSRGNVHRTFTGFVVDGALPPLGSKIQLDGKDVGRLPVWLPFPWPRASGWSPWGMSVGKRPHPASNSPPRARS